MSKTNIENGTAKSSALWVDLTKEECFEICAKYKDRPFSLLVAGMYLLPVPDERMPQTVCGQKVGGAWICTER